MLSFMPSSNRFLRTTRIIHTPLLSTTTRDLVGTKAAAPRNFNEIILTPLALKIGVDLYRGELPSANHHLVSKHGS